MSGTGTSDEDFDNSNFGVSDDYGWFISDHSAWGIRQSVSYADIEGEGVTDDYWNGSTRAYYDYHFGSGSLLPFAGGSLGAVYGDGVNESAFATVQNLRGVDISRSIHWMRAIVVMTGNDALADRENWLNYHIPRVGNWIHR